MIYILILLNIILIIINCFLIKELLSFNNLENKILNGIWGDDDEKK